MQRAKHLLGQRRRDKRLSVAAALQQGWQAPVIAIGKQPEAVEQQLQPAEHRSAGNQSHWPDRKTLVARGFAAQGIDQAEFGIGADLTVPALFALGDQ